MESSTAYASGVGGKKSDTGSTVLKEEMVDPIFFSFLFVSFCSWCIDQWPSKMDVLLRLMLMPRWTLYLDCT